MKYIFLFIVFVSMQVKAVTLDTPTSVMKCQEKTSQKIVLCAVFIKDDKEYLVIADSKGVKKVFDNENNLIYLRNSI